MDGEQATERSKPVSYKPSALQVPLEVDSSWSGDSTNGCNTHRLCQRKQHFQSQFYSFGLITCMSARGPSASISLGSLIAIHCSRF